MNRRRELHSQVVKADRYGRSPDGDRIVMVASNVGLSVCGECDHIHFWLTNDAGEPFATATYAIENLDDLCNDIQQLKANVLTRRH